MRPSNNIENHPRQLNGLVLALVGLVLGMALTLASTNVAATTEQSYLATISSSPRQQTAMSLNRWSSNGPDGGPVRSFAIARSNPATIYAGMDGSGIFKSTNGGESWSTSLTNTEANTYVRALAIDPANPMIVYAAREGSNAGIFKSTDGGTSWHANNVLDVAALAIDPANPNIIYAGLYGVFKSTDGGGSWSEVGITNGMSPETVLLALTIDPINPNTIYAAGAIHNADIVYKSTNGGQSWTASLLTSDNAFVRSVAIDPGNPNVIYAGTPSGAFKSTNGAQSWSAFNEGLTNRGVNALAVDPGNASIVYAGTFPSGVFKSINGGRWNRIDTGLPGNGVSTLVMDPVQPNVIYAGTNDGIFKTTSSGATWSAANHGLHGVRVDSLAINPGNGKVYGTGSSSSTFGSTDNGGSWTPSKFYPLAFDHRNANTIYARVAGDDGMFKSTDGGATWNGANAGLGNTYVNGLAIDPNNSDIIYAGTDHGVFKSTNGGGGWSVIGNPNVTFYNPLLLVIDPTNSEIIYAVANSYDDTAVYKSTDGGITWIGLNLNYVFGLTIDPINTATIYVSTYYYAEMYKSTDGGGSWSLIDTGLPGSDAYSTLVIDPVHPNVLYAGLYGDGVFKSADGGASWNPLNDGLTNLNVYALAIDASGYFLHAGTPAGVFDIQLSVPLQTNQIDDAQFFVRQHYRDFLNREPDASGLAYWTDRITQCGSDARCIHERRIGVSAAFFIELEFQDTGYFVYRFYKASFGRQPNYAEFTSDRSKVIGGSNLEAKKQAFADEWVQRPAFVSAYPITMSNTEVVNKLFDSAGLTASIYDAQRQQEIQALNAGRSRALVLRDVIEVPDFKNIPDPNNPRYAEIKQISQYNPAFVLMQYFGYLRRNVDQRGYDFWLDVVNNRDPNDFRGMVCSFITSTEYQLRFGSGVTRSNADCGQ